MEAIFAGFCEMTSKFDLIVFQIRKPVFCSSRGGDPLNFEKNLFSRKAYWHRFF
jgi:hypothetical protein